jgi:hypothetical protein
MQWYCCIGQSESGSSHGADWHNCLGNLVRGVPPGVVRDYGSLPATVSVDRRRTAAPLIDFGGEGPWSAVVPVQNTSPQCDGLNVPDEQSPAGSILVVATL